MFFYSLFTFNSVGPQNWIWSLTYIVRNAVEFCKRSCFMFASSKDFFFKNKYALLTNHLADRSIFLLITLKRTTNALDNSQAKIFDSAATGQARLIRSHSSARFSFKLSGNSNYIIHCNSNYVQNFELKIISI